MSHFDWDFKIFICFFLLFLCPFTSLLSTNRDSTYREDDPRLLDEFHSNGTLAKSSSCSSFLIDVLFRGIYRDSFQKLNKKSRFVDALTHSLSLDGVVWSKK